MIEQNYLKTELTNLIQTDEATWQFLQEGSLDGIWYWDLENTENEWMSPEFWRTFGIDPLTKTHHASEWQDIIFQSDLALALENFQAHCADPNHPYDQIVRYRHADGSTVWIRCRGLAIRDSSGKPIRMLGAHTDMTAVKRSEEDARAGWRAAEASNEELRSFAYAISHDIKAPANTLQLLLEELELSAQDSLDDASKDILSMAHLTVERMKGLIEDILGYTRVMGKDDSFEMVDLAEIAHQAIDNLHADIEASGAQIQIGHLPSIRASRLQMNILFQNLIGNAIKFRAPGVPPVINVSERDDPGSDMRELVFKDNGIGIAKDQQDRIFKLFQRLHDQSEIEGSGIGLPMCLRIALNHKGDLKLSSEPGKGSEFVFCVPRHFAQHKGGHLKHPCDQCHSAAASTAR